MNRPKAFEQLVKAVDRYQRHRDNDALHPYDIHGVEGAAMVLADMLRLERERVGHV